MGFLIKILGIDVLKLLFSRASWGKILVFMKKYWKLILIAIFILGLAWKHYHLIQENEELKKANAETNIVLQTYMDSEKHLQNQLENQNKEIDRLNKEGQERQKTFSEALRNARKSIQQRDEEINKLLRAKPKDETCESSIEWMFDIKKELQW